MTPIDHWLARIAKLKVDKAPGDPAPHKPLLLLVLFELAERGELPDRELPLTPELAFRFCSFWRIVAGRRSQNPDVRYPFHHLRSAGFWSCLTEERSPSTHRMETRYAALDPGFVAFARDPVAREQARRILIAKYFRPEERISLYTLLGMALPSDDEILADASFKSPEDAQKKGREVRFRLDVVAAYDYTCALTRYRLITIMAGSIVDAAHIHDFSKSKNNDRRNGLALCKNAHWQFDNGLWTLSDDFKVLVAKRRFAEHSPNQTPLSNYEGQKIHLPADTALWPAPSYLDWHRKNRFLGS
jgi:putative restriction endonuclease